MRNRTYLPLGSRVLLTALLIGILFVQGSFSFESAETVILKLKSRADAASLSLEYGVRLVDSIPELDKYLVRGESWRLAAVRRDPDVQSVEYDLETEISERAMLSESTVALLDPDTVALLDSNEQMWDGQHWVRSSILNQPAFQKIGFVPSSDPVDPVTVAVIDTGIDPFHEMLVGSTLPGRNFIDEGQSTDELRDLDPRTAALLQAGRGSAGMARSLAVLNSSTVAILPPSLAASLQNVVSPYFGHGTMISGLVHAIAPVAGLCLSRSSTRRAGVPVFESQRRLSTQRPPVPR